MGALIAVQALALIVLAVLVVGLLRSHAEILQRLHDLGVNLDDDGQSGHNHGGGRNSQVGPVSVPPPSPRNAGQGAPAISGVTPFDEAVTLAPDNGDTVLAFLTTGCTSCQPFWDALKQPQRDRVVIVTRGAGDESQGTARKLAKGSKADVVMSSEAWDDYGVPGAPYFVHVSGTTGKVTGEGTARSWDQVQHLLERANSDDEGPPGPWSTDAGREQYIDKELEAAGIRPGDPRLYHQTTDD
jgi:hypothetical protein